jgi:hypothetical protein
MRRTRSDMFHGVALAFALATAACINRPGMNLECHWPTEPKRPLDLRNAEHLAHLAADIEVADELVVRYRDEMIGRRPRPWLRIQVRTRMSSPPPADSPPAEHAKACRARMTEAIVATHSVTSSQLADVTQRLADRGADLPVTLPVFLLYGFVVHVVGRSMRSRIVDETRAVQLAAVFLVSIAIAAAVVIVGGVWSGVIEIVRVGNEHLSFRASRIGWPRRAPVWFLATMIGFWAFAAVGLLRRRPAS